MYNNKRNSGILQAFYVRFDFINVRFHFHRNTIIWIHIHFWRMLSTIMRTSYVRQMALHWLWMSRLLLNCTQLYSSFHSWYFDSWSGILFIGIFASVLQYQSIVGAFSINKSLHFTTISNIFEIQEFNSYARCFQFKESQR